MAKAIKPTDLGASIADELTTYREGVVERVNDAGADAIKKLVRRTKATAPKRSGSFKKNIASKTFTAHTGTGMKAHVWYVKPPDHRITHLLVHGHAKLDGGRVPGDPFLQNALDAVLPEYEKAVKEAVKNG